MLFIDINIDDISNWRIIIYENDNAEDVARLFAKQHNLDDQTRTKLQGLIHQQIENLLTKIDEEEEDYDYHNSSFET